MEIKKKLILFDIDGTLIDSVAIDNSTFQAVLSQKFNTNISDSEYYNYLYKAQGTDSGLFRYIMGSDLPMDDYKTIERKFKYYFHKQLRQNFQDYKEKLIEITGASVFLDSLYKDKNIVLGIATGSWRLSGLIKLKLLNIHFTPKLYGNADKYYSKYEILLNIIKKAVSKNKKPFEKIIYFGDSQWDFEVVNQLGIDFIGVDYYCNNILKKLGAKKIIKEYSNLIKMYEYIQ